MKTKILIIVGLIVVLTTVVFWQKDYLVQLFTDPIATVSPSPSPEDIPFEGFPDQSLVQTPVPPNQLSGPGSCQLSGGKITFLEPGLARHDRATLSYKNIDHPARLIKWQSFPADDILRVGPNIFSGLKLPQGETKLTVNFDKNPTVKNYTLTATVTYGVFKDGGVVSVAEAQCGGDIKVEFDY